MGKKVNGVSLEAVEQVTKTEQAAQERKTIAAGKAKQMIADAERSGQELLAQVRAKAAENEKDLLQQAEAKAKEHTAELLQRVGDEGETLRKTARTHLTETAEWIAGRVVSH